MRKLLQTTPLQRLEKDSKLEFEKFEENQHFTQPPAHFTEASLVKALEEQGIGRPSTYAPTIINNYCKTLCNKRKEKSLCYRVR